MKIMINILSIILLYVNIILAQNCTSIVDINTGSDDILIFIDNKYAGNGKIEVELEKGEHIVKIKEPGFRWGARGLSKNLNIDSCGNNYSFSIQLNNEYLLETIPSDAYVYNADTLLGNTPLFISSDIRNVLLEKYDYKSMDLTISGMASLKPITLDFTGELKSKSFTETPFFGMLIGTAVGFGAVAAYYKIQADQSFNKYESTKEQKYLDETSRFDNYSGIALGILQLNFGALIYFLLSD